MKQTNVLEMRGINKSFPGVNALKNVDFSVCKGEAMALMGENGAGKSTLVKIMTGIYTRDSGEMFFDGKEVNPDNPLAAQKIGISTIYQELNLSPYLSVAENIYLGKPPKKNGLIDWKKMNNMAREAMLKLGIDVDVEAPLNTQSTAVQQMVSIARANTEQMKLLIMDEATSSLTENEIDILFTLVKQLKEQEVSVIFITHKLDEIYRICDRATILKDGEFVTCEALSELPKLKLISHMIGRDATSLITKKKVYSNANQGRDVLCSVKDIAIANKRLNGVDLEICKGEVVGIAGLLGAGKTELAKVIFGDNTHYYGEVYYEGKIVKFKSPYDAVKKGAGFVPEDRKVEGIFPYMSVQDNLTLTIMGKISRGGIINHKRMRQITVDYIDRIKIKTPDTSTMIRNLSGGNQQKVILARWLTTEPDLIILDEPTRGIDVGTKGEIEDIVEEIAHRGISVLYISSELEELVRQCDRIAVLSEGKKIKEFVGEEISTEAITREMAKEHHEDGFIGVHHVGGIDNV